MKISRILKRLPKKVTGFLPKRRKITKIKPIKTKGREVGKLLTNPDGSTIFLSDGNVASKKPDGTTKVSLPGVGRGYTTPNGTKILEYEEGTTIHQNLDGTQLYSNPRKKIRLGINKDGTRITDLRAPVQRHHGNRGEAGARCC
jgi:hypothetical protein